ncbi:DUF554 domain-containing protein [Rummeliibacillus sp. NPDC094406]|uniref:DUF554 domain-containing protein n=1 Tax=Rummeliibacillus sp. NPDC094406 TaxID=3364511 RepID=UPI003829FA23
MVLLGTIINTLLIAVGAVIGRFLQGIPDKMKETVMQVIGLAVTVLGIQMGITSNNFIVVIVSLVIGTVIGEWIDLDLQLNRIGKWLEYKIGNKGEHGDIAQGFITSTLIFVIGSMAIIGALDSGLRNDHSVLITKGIIDGFTAIFLASTLGIGVLLSAVSVFLYQGLIALFAGQISSIVPVALLDTFVQQLTATGGAMIIAIGLNMMGLTKIRVANILPAILVVAIVVTIMHIF